MRIYLDSCIVIYLVQGPSPYQQSIDAAFSKALASDGRFCVSDLTRLECRVLPLRIQDLDLLRQYDEFFGQPEIEHLATSSKVFDLATELRARHHLKTADTLHLAAALHHGCDVFWTNDQRLSNAVSDKRLHIVSPMDPIPKD